PEGGKPSAELPARGALGEVFLTPSHHRAHVDAEQDRRPRKPDEMELVLAEVRAVDPGGDLGRARRPFDDHDFVTALDVDDGSGIRFQVARFARARVGLENESTVEPEAPNRSSVGSLVRTRAAYPVVVRAAQALLGK